MKRIALFTLSFIPIVGYAGPKLHHKSYPSYKYSEKNFDDKKAVVIMKMSPSSYDLSLVKFANDDGSEFTETDENSLFNHAYRIKEGYFSKQDTILMMVEPGYYAFNDIGNAYYSSSVIAGKGVSYGIFYNTYYFPISYGAFYAPAGKVTDLGQINIDVKEEDPGFSFIITQSPTEDTKQYLKDKHPKLAEKAEKARYFKQGSRFKYS